VFGELLATPGVREVCTLRSPFGFMAFHGGSLEVMTDVVAERAADASGASYYGVLQPPELRWHLPSTAFDPAESETLAGFLDHVDVVVTVHGYGRVGLWTSLLIGGGNRALAAEVARHVGDALPHYRMVTDLEAIPSGLRGLHPGNPVNRPRQGGAQVELPPRVRGLAPVSPPPGADGLTPDTRALIEGLTRCARAGCAETNRFRVEPQLGQNPAGEH
jgi:phage replication-related protein YjqB (UPF0714/DUF867 family)